MGQLYYNKGLLKRPLALSEIAKQFCIEWVRTKIIFKPAPIRYIFLRYAPKNTPTVVKTMADTARRLPADVSTEALAKEEALREVWERAERTVLGPIILTFILLLTILPIAAKPGCLSDRAGVANTKRVPVRPVECYCPCDRYKRDPRRNTCVKCGHFHADTGFGKRRSIPAKQPWELLGME